MSLTRMEYLILDEKRPLTGDEMQSHWAYRDFGLLGDSIVSFCGPFEVPKERWIDLDSLKRGLELPNLNMLHFVVEHFDSNLNEAMLRQYILISILEEKILHRISIDNHRLVRLGDDLFEGENRLSVTAAGSTPVSIKLHLGVFLEARPTDRIHGLIEYGIDSLELAGVVVNQYRVEMRRLSEKAWRMRPII